MFNLEAKYHKYLELIQTVQDPASGFIEAHECDSLLFSGLVGCVPEVTVGICTAYDKKKNQWFRRPLSQGSCYNPDSLRNQKSLKTRLKDSWDTYRTFKKEKLPVDWDYIFKKVLLKQGSTISRDMLTGLAWYAWHNQRLDISEKIIERAVKNWGFMGDGDISRINIMPGLFATFCWISYKLGGPSRAWARWIPADGGGKGLEGYQAHLQVLHILLRTDVSGKTLSKKESAVLAYHAAREPGNPLFLHCVGEDLKALEILSDERIWPTDRLPRVSDRKEPWLLQRDYGADWKPEISSRGFHHHSGGDFLWMYWLIQRKYEIKKT